VSAGRQKRDIHNGALPIELSLLPVSAERFGRDVIYVNDVPVQRIEDIPRVVAEYASDGAAITGGDPPWCRSA